jgi:hypothetical protein
MSEVPEAACGARMTIEAVTLACIRIATSRLSVRSLHPHHEHPESRKDRRVEEHRGQQRVGTSDPEGLPHPAKVTGTCHAPHRSPTASPTVRTP